MGGESSSQPCTESLTSLDYPQKALEIFFRRPKSLTRLLTGAGRAFLRDGHRYETPTSDCDSENCRKVALPVILNEQSQIQKSAKVTF